MFRRGSLFLMVASLFVCSFSATADESSDKDSPDAVAIKKMFEEHRKAFSNHDVEKVKTFYADDAVMMGTGPGELWIGQEEIGDAYTHFCQDFEKGGQKHKITWQRPKIKGDVAWIMMTLDESQDRPGDDDPTYQLNMSVVLEKVGGDWKFSTVHFSNLTGGK